MTPIEKFVPQVVAYLEGLPIPAREWTAPEKWLASLVVEMVKERARTHFYAKGYGPTPDASFKEWDECISIALNDFSISQADYEWLKGKEGK